MEAPASYQMFVHVLQDGLGLTVKLVRQQSIDLLFVLLVVLVIFDSLWMV